VPRAIRTALLQLPAFSIDEAEASLNHTMRRIDEVAGRERPDLIVLPEVTYPAYFLGSEDLASRGVLSPAGAAARFSAKAREHGVFIAAGLAVEGPDGRYANGAILFDRSGNQVGRYDKSFLFHFDTKWFAAGGTYPVFDTEIGRIGMLVCADGRLPEIARCLALNGAQIILDLTAWVSTGRDAAALTSTQFEYLMRVRAAENGVWVACCDKSGVEADSIVYAGRSCFIDPAGEVVASLGSEEDAELVYDVPLEEPSPRIIRRPELYENLTHPTESLPAVRSLDEPFVMSASNVRIAVAQLTMPPTGEEFLALARAHAHRQSVMDSDALVFPATPSRLRAAYAHDRVLEGMIAIASETGVCLAFTVSEPDAGGWRAMYLVGPRGVLAKHRQTHKPAGERFASMPMGEGSSPVVDTPFGRVGLIVAAELFVPEVARSLMLRGAEILLCCADDPPIPMAMFARTRAEENRVYVAAAGAPTDRGTAVVVEPGGRVLAQALHRRQLVLGAAVNRALAHNKQYTHGTDVLLNRKPETYGVLTRRAVEAVV
jgi:predicted amidohydrolase